MIKSSDMAPNAILLHVNRIQLAGRPVIRNGPVGSRMLLRCLEGVGKLRVNGELREFRGGEWFFLPWRHTIHYFAETSRSFLLDGFHLVPTLPVGAECPVQFSIPHQPGDPLADLPWRGDTVLPELEGVVAGRFVPDSPFDRFCSYAVERFAEAAPDEAVARHLAALLLVELLQQRRVPEAQALPPPLVRVLAHLRSHLEQPHTIAGLAQYAACSPATLNRLFRRHLGRSPLDWLLQERLAVAERLLLTTGESVGAIGRRVGFADASYFSRLFRQRRGETIRAFRARRAFGFF